MRVDQQSEPSRVWGVHSRAPHLCRGWVPWKTGPGAALSSVPGATRGNMAAECTPDLQAAAGNGAKPGKTAR
ncbi:hypothetical protein GCM10023329_24630 [Streptomyces sanyensis]|uniref:Uncharacterized protein n=1 Tax=Streptomyces sanyensis TaxID=568869 RepID=A0ABP9A6H7_9ACTN